MGNAVMSESEQQAIERKLTTILSADVAGYSQMMEADEAGTFRRLRQARATIDTLLTRHRGRIANTAGDSVLVNFPSAVEAAACAIAIQDRFDARNSNSEGVEPLRFRIGINLGDVMVEPDGDIFGDGVNVAARLQGLAEPGAILVSRTVKELVQDKLEVTFSAQGPQQLRNLAQSVEVFALSAGKAKSVDRLIAGDFGIASQAGDTGNSALMALAAIMIVAGLVFDHWVVWPGIGLYWFCAGPLITGLAADSERRNILQMGKTIFGLALINLASLSPEPWFLYPSFFLVLVYLWRRRKRTGA